MASSISTLPNYASFFHPTNQESSDTRDSSSDALPSKKPFLPPPRCQALQETSADSARFQELIQDQDPASVDLISRGWDFFKQFDRLELISFSTSLNDAKWAQKEVDHLTQKWLELRKAEREKEQSSRKWGVAQQVFTWMGSIMALLTGIGLIMTGVGAVAGAMMVAGGAIALTSQILKTTGVWDKITHLIPSSDPEKRAAISSWIQIGILVFSLILLGTGVVYSGFSLVSKASSIAMACFGSIVAGGQGVVSIGKGLVDSEYYNTLSDVKTYEAHKTEKRHLKEEAVERMNAILQRRAGLNEFRTEYLELVQNLNEAFQSGLKRG